ncbi:MAG: hypothetical protein L0154_06120 [Chloroflexi bacterium]|nr:hypothetical protein [Chloroflexota bacterium]
MDNISQIEEIMPGITRYWLDDHTISLIVSDDAERHKVDAWANAIIEQLENWPSNEPYLAIYDVSRSALTPYTRKKSEEIARKAIELKGEDYPTAYALVLQRGVLGNILKLFVIRDIGRRYPMWNVHVFHTQDDAVAWVRSMREPLRKEMRGSEASSAPNE